MRSFGRFIGRVLKVLATTLGGVARAMSNQGPPPDASPGGPAKPDDYRP
jgi:hypothetical protein